MSLTPLAEAVIAQMREAMPVAMTALPINDLRASTTLPPSPISVHTVRESKVAGKGGPIPVRVYRPEADGALPVVLWLHGGGFAIGDLSMSDDTCRRLANTVGAVVVNVEYRLAPEHPYPAGFEDCVAVYQWILSGADDLGEADTTRVAVGGDSAGGNLTMALTQFCRDTAIPMPRCQVSVYGTAEERITNPEFGDLPLLYNADAEWFWTAYAASRDLTADPYANPARGELTGLSPLLAITAEHDPTRDGTENYARAAETAGTEVILRRFAGMPHGFFSMPDVLPEADEAWDLTIGFLRDKLGLNQ